MWSPPVPTAPSAVPVAGEVWDMLLLFLACQGLASPFPHPHPARAVGAAPRAWGKPNCQNSSRLQSHMRGWVSLGLCILCPSGQNPRSQNGALGRQGPGPSFTCPTWALWPGVACPGLSVFIASVSIYVPSSGPPGLPPLPPGSEPTFPAGPPWTQPGHLWDQACTVGASPVPPLPGQALVGIHRNLSLLLLF